MQINTIKLESYQTMKTVTAWYGGTHLCSQHFVAEARKSMVKNGQLCFNLISKKDVQLAYYHKVSAFPVFL